MEGEGNDCYVKYPGWDRDLKGACRPFEAESFMCDKTNDQWICPQGKPLSFVRTETYTRTELDTCTRDGATRPMRRRVSDVRWEAETRVPDIPPPHPAPAPHQFPNPLVITAILR